MPSRSRARNSSPRSWSEIGEREHAGEVVDDVAAPLLEAAQDDLGVGVVGDEPPAPLLELAPQLGVVVDLAVEDEREVAVVAVERLVAGRDVDDREPAHADREVRADVGALAVGAAVHDRPQHLFQQLGIGAGEPDDATHRAAAYGRSRAVGFGGQSGSGGASVLGPTLRSSQRLTGAASRHVVTMRSGRGGGVHPPRRAERAARRGSPFMRSSSTRGWSGSKPRGTRFSESRARDLVPLLAQRVDRGRELRPGPVVGDRGAEALELIALQVVVAAADVQALGRELHVVRRAALASR